ncbi:MAG: hypothetical protein HYT97_10220, partial [Elusimicrobia bacterium]|nr:hypothetical protein [Elusimicrobiota bacterium]
LKKTSGSHSELKQQRSALNVVVQEVIHINKVIQINHNSNRIEKFILSIAYLSYPINVLTHHLFNLTSNFTRPLGKWRLDPLTKSGVGVDQYDWATREQGIANIRDGIKKNRPDLLERYESLNQLSLKEREQEEESLRNELYRITLGHFQVWGLSVAMDSRKFPYFNGSYIDALMVVFPDLNLNPLRFKLEWSSKEKGVESVRYILSREIPHIMERYERIAQLDDRDVHDLRNAIYGITQAHFNVWGLGSAMTQESAPYFHRSYINALMAVFPDLNLNPLGFQLDWSSEERGIESVKFVLSREVSHIMQQYERIVELSDREIHDLRNQIYGIKQAHFKVWGLSRAISQKSVPYFHGSYKDVLISVFNHPKLELTLQGFKDFRRATFERKYVWKTLESGIWSVRETIRSNRPDIIARYENLGQLEKDEIERLKRAIYGISSGYFQVWALGGAMNQKSAPYFYGSHIVALMAVFPDLNLNPLGFQLDWSIEERGIASVKYVLSKEVPHVMERYEKIIKLSDGEIHELINEIYGITSSHFQVWGLGRAMNQELAPYFHGTYMNALMAVFPDLNLNPLGFRLDWSGEERGIESVRYVLSKEGPHIMQQYERIAHLNERDIHDLRNEIYGIKQGHFQVWGLSAAMDHQKSPYFQGSYITALLAVFSDPKLGLTREGFVERSENRSSGAGLGTGTSENENSGVSVMAETTGNEGSGSNLTIEDRAIGDSASPLMTEDTRSEALKQGINPTGWIAQLFFAPHYEFLDTFNPVQFFKSHREQTVGQAIGIVLIWGAMVAAMIGAPFGIDFLLSGSSTNHLSITLLSSFIGFLSIVAGIRLNQLKQISGQLSGIKQQRSVLNVVVQEVIHINKVIQINHNSNRIEKFILSIAYFSYPINVLTHHLFNLTSNFTRLLGKWRLAPLTKVRVGEDQYDWTTREQGIENVRDAIRKNRPDLFERYEDLNRLSPKEREQEKESLRKEIYRITSGHFTVWGLSGAMDVRKFPYFNGSYINALIAVFPDLNLNPLGFQLDWSSEEKGIESVRYVLSKEVPHIMQEYKRLDQLSERDTHDLRNKIYGITSGHIKVWGLSGVMRQESAPYFHGSHINALIAVFPNLNLNSLGFRLDWSNEERGIESVRYVLSKEVPHIMQRYERIAELSDREIHNLRNEIYGITQGNFQIWGLSGAMNQQVAPYFHGSYINVLISIFNQPRLGLTLQGFKNYRKAAHERKYSWGTRESGIWSVREAIRSNSMDIIERYENIGQLKKGEIEKLKRDIYRITSGHFKIWGLSAAINYLHAPYFLGSYVIALMAVFPDLNLNPLVFRLDWSSKEIGIESVRYVLSKEVPHIMHEYERLNKLSEREIDNLRSKVYEITNGHFNVWGLGGAMVQRQVPYFNGSHINALMAVFPDLNLNPLWFQLDWSSEERGIESVRYVLSKEVPHIMQEYKRLDQLSERDTHDLRNKIYGITSGHINVWGLGTAMNQKLAPYFHGSYMNALLVVFSHPTLGLTREGFVERAENGSSDASQMTEISENENLASSVMIETAGNEDSGSNLTREDSGTWDPASPLMTFLDTFNPVQFFKSHKEQTVGQAIGIVLIWGAMVAAMIGAPFGIDFLLSGSPTAHLGYDLIGSLAGSISIVAGIRLNQLSGYKSNHTEKVILSIAYLSYPINVLTHHLFNFISNLTRPLGKRRLAPLTKIRVGEDQYDWATREQGIENVRDAIRKNRPDLFERYENLNQLSLKEREQEEESLRKEIYRITFGHFQIWGLSVAMDSRKFPYFNGSYIDALMAVFPDLNLNPLGFQVDWSSEAKGIESVKYVLSKEAPHIMQQYERIAELNDREIHDLRNEIYGIKKGHFEVWGLGGAMKQESVPYFNGSYMYVLISVFNHPRLGLSLQGFKDYRKATYERKYSWGTRESGIWSVREGIRSNRSDIIDRYENLELLKEDEIERLMRDIYGITFGHFKVWGLGGAMNRKVASYFHGSYINALMAVFPDLNLNPLGFNLDWSSEAKGIESVKYVFTKEVPHIMHQYESIAELSDREIHDLRNEIYKITYGHFKVWGLGGAMNQESAPYFHGSYIDALMAVFPDLNLNPLGFQLDWSSEAKGIESVKYVLTKEVPQIMQQYERIAQLNDREIHDLRNKI